MNTKQLAEKLVSHKIGRFDISKACERIAYFLKRTDVNEQWNGVCLMQDKIKSEVGSFIERYPNEHIGKNVDVASLYEKYGVGDVSNDIFSYCSELMDKITNFSFDDYCRDVFPLNDLPMGYRGADCYDETIPDTNLVYESLWLITGHTKNEKDNIKDDTVGMRCSVKYSELLDANRSDNPVAIYRKYGGAAITYLRLHNTIEYELCKRIYNYLYEKGKWMWFFDEYEVCREPNVADLVRMVKLIFLYIALQTEKERIEEDAAVQGVQLTAPATDAPGLPTEAMKPSEGATTPKQDKRASQIKIAQPYFERAIAESMMAANDDGTYNWKLSNIDLAYFIRKIFEPKQPPYSTFEPLFGIEGLSKSWHNHTQTYKHKHKDGKQSQAQSDIDYLIDYVKDDVKEQGNR